MSDHTVDKKVQDVSSTALVKQDTTAIVDPPLKVRALKEKTSILPALHHYGVQLAQYGAALQAAFDATLVPIEAWTDRMSADLRAELVAHIRQAPAPFLDYVVCFQDSVSLSIREIADQIEQSPKLLLPHSRKDLLPAKTSSSPSVRFLFGNKNSYYDSYDSRGKDRLAHLVTGDIKEVQRALKDGDYRRAVQCAAQLECTHTANFPYTHGPIEQLHRAYRLEQVIADIHRDGVARNPLDTGYVGEALCLLERAGPEEQDHVLSGMGAVVVTLARQLGLYGPRPEEQAVVEYLNTIFNEVRAVTPRAGADITTLEAYGQMQQLGADAQQTVVAYRAQLADSARRDELHTALTNLAEGIMSIAQRPTIVNNSIEFQHYGFGNLQVQLRR